MKKTLHGLLTLFMVLIVQLTFAQQKMVTGTVVDEEGLPLPGVNVIEKGTNNGVQTNFDGEYSIEIQDGSILVFSYVGFASQEKAVGNSATIDVTMLVDASALDEVVVMGYSAVSRDDVTGSAVQLDSERIQQTTTASVDQALQGKVAGLNVSTGSGTPGSFSNIRIRGRSSINASNEPLYVIDGVPVVNTNMSGAGSGSSMTALASINSNDIESITVLKDASATAQYGARGANGVIVITTKSGKSGKTRFTLTSSFGFQNDAIDGPEVLTGAEREMLWYEALYNDYGASEGFDLSGAQQFYEDNTASFGNDYVVWNNAGRPETDWASLITNDDAPIQQHNFSASGGNESHSFFASVGYYDQEATVIGSDFERISGSLNFTKNFNENFKFTTSNTASHSYQDGLLEGSSYFSSPRTVKYFNPSIDQAYNDDGSYNLNTAMPNPLFIAENDIDENRLTRILTNNQIEWKTPIENLTFSSRVSIDLQMLNYKRYRNRIRGDGDATNGYGFQSHRSMTTYVFQNSFDYSLYLGNHNFDFKVLQEFQKNRNYSLSADGEQFGTDGLTNLSSAGVPTSAYSEFTDWAVAAYMGTLSYNYDRRYVFNATYRREGNSRFAADQRWGDFYSFGTAWNLHRESFLMDSDAISNLKLRASYGKTGNAGIGLNTYQVLFGYDADYAGTAAAYPSTYGNENLTWETSDSYDLGLDFGFFNNRLNGTFAYYYRETKDMLLAVPLSRTTGFTSQNRNIGRMQNSGVEVELSFDAVRSEDFNLSIGGNLATNKNEVLEMATDLNGNAINITTTQTRTEAGHPASGWYMPTWAGVNPDTGLDEWYVDGIAGEDSETTSNFNDAERAWQGGSALPEISAGLNIHIDFKGFFLDADAFFQGGHKIYESWHLYTHDGNAYSLNAYQGINTMLGRWQQPGDQTRYAKVTTAYSPWRYNSKYLFDGDFARLRNVTVGYDFEPSVLESIGLTGARIYVRGTNLATWVKDDNLELDPEVDPTGFTDMFTPPSKNVVLGVNLNF